MLCTVAYSGPISAGLQLDVASTLEVTSHHRFYTDSAGVAWTVEERERTQGKSSELSLVFASTVALRFVRNYPLDWFTYDERALENLSWKT